MVKRNQLYRREYIFEVLYQKSEKNRMPLMVSVLRRELHDNNSFSDFYQSWFPSDEMCNPVEVGGQAGVSTALSCVLISNIGMQVRLIMWI